VSGQSIALVGCGKSKIETGDTPVPACELYTGSLFRAAYNYACLAHDRVLIVSAFHHVMRPDYPVYTYERELPKSPNERRDWGARCANMLTSCFGVTKEDDIYIYAGHRYTEAILAQLHGYRVHTLLKGMTMGRRLQWFKQMRELVQTAEQNSPTGG
jgi:hypothetical protein